MKKNIYWGPPQEKIVAEYLQTNDEKLFKEKVYPLLRKIAYGVCGGKQFKPVTLYRSRTVIDRCISHLWECLKYKYDPTKGRTFSYLTTCAFHYFCGVSRTYQKSPRTRLFVNGFIEQEWENMHRKRGVDHTIEKKEIDYFYYEILLPALNFERNKIGRDKPHSVKNNVAQQLYKTVAQVHDSPGPFHKKAFFLEIRNATGATTKQIKATIDKNFKPRYLRAKKVYHGATLSDMKDIDY